MIEFMKLVPGFAYSLLPQFIRSHANRVLAGRMKGFPNCALLMLACFLDGDINLSEHSVLFGNPQCHA
jgi:hypothetical protein